MASPDKPQWQITPQEVAELLGTEPESVRNGAFGTGQRYTLPAGSLELYAKAGVAKVRNADGSMTSQIRVADEPTLDAKHGQVILFQSEPRAALAFRTDGSFDAVSSPHATGRPADQIEPTASENGGSGDSAAQEQAAEDESETVIQAADRFRGNGNGEEKEQQERVKFTGRLGREATFSKTPKGTPVARLSVGERTEDGKTTWHRVIALKDVAEGIQQKAEAGQLPVGKTLQVTGYRQERDYTDREGRQQHIVEVRAIGINAVGAKGTDWSVWAKRKPQEGSQQAQ